MEPRKRAAGAALPLVSLNAASRRSYPVSSRTGCDAITIRFAGIYSPASKRDNEKWIEYSHSLVASAPAAGCAARLPAELGPDAAVSANTHHPRQSPVRVGAALFLSTSALRSGRLPRHSPPPTQSGKCNLLPISFRSTDRTSPPPSCGRWCTHPSHRAPPLSGGRTTESHITTCLTRDDPVVVRSASWRAVGWGRVPLRLLKVQHPEL